MIFLNNYNVYKHTFPDGKIYIGVSTNPLKRWSNGHGYYFNEELDKAIKEVGWENIKHEILFENLSKEEANNKEKELIKFYNSTNKEKGFNRTTGGIKGCKFVFYEDEPPIIRNKKRVETYRIRKSINIDKKVYNEFMLYASCLGRSVSSLIEQFMRETLKEIKKEK